MNFISSLKWPVPDSFSDSIAKKRFQAGDIFYDHEAAYGQSWGEALQKVRRIIQVQSSDAFSVSIRISTVSHGRIESTKQEKLTSAEFVEILKNG